MTVLATSDAASNVNVDPSTPAPHRPASPLVGETPLPFPQLCAKIHDRITAFLAEQDASPRVKGLQEQTRIALGVIEKALDQYRYVVLSSPPSRSVYPLS
jgi:FAD synthetase